MILKVE